MNSPAPPHLPTKLRQCLRRWPSGNVHGAQPLAAALSTALIIIAGTWTVAALIASLLHTPLPPPATSSRPASPAIHQIADQLASHLRTDESPEAAATRPPSMYLTATLGTGDPALARAILMVDGAEKPLVARIGDRIGETWQVVAITPRDVRLTHADRHTNITLTLPGNRRQDVPATADAKERD